MASSSPAVAVKKEKKSTLWSTPPYPGNGQNNKTQSTHDGSSIESDLTDSDSSDSQDSISNASEKPAPKPAYQKNDTATAVPSSQHSTISARAAPSSLDSAPGSDQKTVRTHRVVTVDAKGFLLHPSKTAIAGRMNSLYPGFRDIMAGINDSDASSSVLAQTSNRSRASHIESIWKIVTTVDAEIKAKLSAGANPLTDVNRGSTFGVRINYLINLYQATKKPHGAGQAAQNDAAGSGSSTQKDDLPSHEEMMAYRILNARHDFPPYIVKALRETEFEYLLYPLAPAGPAIKDAKPTPTANCPSTQNQIAESKAKLKQAENRLCQQKKRFEAEKEQEELAARKRYATILFKLKKSEARSTNVKDIILDIQKSVNDAAKTHSQRLSSLHDLLDHASESQEERKVGEKDLREVESQERETSGEETSEEETSEEGDAGENQRPAKIRRIS